MTWDLEEGGRAGKSTIPNPKVSDRVGNSAVSHSEVSGCARETMIWNARMNGRARKTATWNRPTSIANSRACENCDLKFYSVRPRR